MIKNYATNAVTCTNCKKSEKCKYLTAALRPQGYEKSSEWETKSCKIILAFIFILMLKLKNQPPTENLRKTAKMTKKNL